MGPKASLISSSWRGDSRSMKCRRTFSTWCGATRSMAAMPLGGQHGERAPLVALAVVAPDQAAVLHPRDLVGQAAPRLAGGVGELGHPQPVVRRLGQLDQDLVVVPVQPVRVQVAVELAQEQLGQVDGGAPRLLLVRAQPARLSVGPGHNTNLPLSREYGDSV